jgi:protein TonB
MPSNALVYSFPSPLGRRGSVALAVAGFHVLLAFALIAGLGVRISTPTPVPLIGVVVPPERTSIPPPQSPLEPSAEELTRTTVDLPPPPRLLDPPPVVAPQASYTDPPPQTSQQPGVSGGGPRLTEPPRLLRSEQPPYPASERRLGREGSVQLRVRVDALGRAEIVEVAESSGSPRLDEAAVRAVQRWLFAPARSADQAVPGWVSLKVTFRLTD